MKKELIYRLFSRIPTVRTERLILRAMKVSDAEDMFDYAHREEVSRYLTWSPHPNLAHTKEYLTYIGQRYRTGDFYDWAIEDAESHRMIGTCGFTCFDFASDAAEIGYVLHPDFRGRGLATEAVRAVLAFGFDELALHRISARYMVENERSRRLMERVGMTFEGVSRESEKIKGAYRSIGRCAILRQEYEEKRHL